MCTASPCPADGRAGMVALVIDPATFDLAVAHRFISEHLPSYARPLFLRIRGEIEVTATFKQKKFDLVREAFDPGETSDAIYFNDPRARASCGSTRRSIKRS